MLISNPRALLLATVLSLGLPHVAFAAGTATLAPITLPTAKATTQELKYAFGKDWEAAMRAEVKDDLAATKLFADIVPENGEVTFTLDVRELKRDFQDRVQLSGKGVLTFTGKGHYSWTRGGVVISEGDFDVQEVLTLDRQPYRSDLSTGWREILRKAVGDGVGAVQGSTQFNDPAQPTK